jgi:EmrB/QacA subfamily drug resistance transporter
MKVSDRPEAAIRQVETLQRSVPPSSSESSKIDSKQLLTLVVCCLAISVIVIDFTIVINALPSIQATFSGVSVKDLEWITSLYGLIFGSFLLTWGKLGDEFGRKRILMAGIAIFVVGSIVDGLSANLSQMLVGRSIQGFGAAMASPSTLSILSTTFTGKARSVAFGMWGAIAGAAGIIGPLMGGYFTTYITWRWSFLINVPLGAITLLVAFYAIKESRFRDPKYSTDYLGVTLITLGLASLLFGFIEAQTYGWLTPNETFTLGSFTWPLSSISLPAVCFIAGALFMAGFTFAELRRSKVGKVPLFDFSLLKYRAFRYGLFTVGIVAVGEFATIFIYSIYFQIGRGLSAINSSLNLAPFAVAMFVFSPIAGRLSNRYGTRRVVTTGMIMETIALFTLFLVTGDSTPFYYFYPVFMLFGAGFGLSLPQLTNTVLASVPFQKAGVASAANNTIRQISAAFGVAVLGAIMVAQISTVGHADLSVANLPIAIKDNIGNLLNSGLTGGVSPALPPGVPAATVGTIHSVITDAITQGVRWAALTAGVFVSFGALSSLLIPNPKASAIRVAKAQTVATARSVRASQVVVVGQFVLIEILLFGLSSEYSANPFMQDWFSQNIWPIGFLLGDYIAPLLGIAVGLIGFVAQSLLKRRDPTRSRVETIAPIAETA